MDRGTGISDTLRQTLMHTQLLQAQELRNAIQPLVKELELTRQALSKDLAQAIRDAGGGPGRRPSANPLGSALPKGFNFKQLMPVVGKGITRSAVLKYAPGQVYLADSIAKSLKENFTQAKGKGMFGMLAAGAAALWALLKKGISGVIKSLMAPFKLLGSMIMKPFMMLGKWLGGLFGRLSAWVKGLLGMTKTGMQKREQAQRMRETAQRRQAQRDRQMQQRRDRNKQWNKQQKQRISNGNYTSAERRQWHEERKKVAKANRENAARERKQFRQAQREDNKRVRKAEMKATRGARWGGAAMGVAAAAMGFMSNASEAKERYVDSNRRAGHTIAGDSGGTAMGALEMGAKGAMIGMAFGPIGAAVGASLGAIIGLIPAGTWASAFAAVRNETAKYTREEAKAAFGDRNKAQTRGAWLAAEKKRATEAGNYMDIVEGRGGTRVFNPRGNVGNRHAMFKEASKSLNSANAGQEQASSYAAIMRLAHSKDRGDQEQFRALISKSGMSASEFYADIKKKQERAQGAANNLYLDSMEGSARKNMGTGDRMTAVLRQKQGADSAYAATSARQQLALLKNRRAMLQAKEEKEGLSPEEIAEANGLDEKAQRKAKTLAREKMKAKGLQAYDSIYRDRMINKQSEIAKLKKGGLSDADAEKAFYENIARDAGAGMDSVFKDLADDDDLKEVLGDGLTKVLQDARAAAQQSLNTSASSTLSANAEGQRIRGEYVQSKLAKAKSFADIWAIGTGMNALDQTANAAATGFDATKGEEGDQYFKSVDAAFQNINNQGWKIDADNSNPLVTSDPKLAEEMKKTRQMQQKEALANRLKTKFKDQLERDMTLSRGATDKAKLEVDRLVDDYTSRMGDVENYSDADAAMAMKSGTTVKAAQSTFKDAVKINGRWSSVPQLTDETGTYQFSKRDQFYVGEPQTRVGGAIKALAGGRLPSPGESQVQNFPVQFERPKAPDATAGLAAAIQRIAGAVQELAKSGTNKGGNTTITNMSSRLQGLTQLTEGLA